MFFNKKCIRKTIFNLCNFTYYAMGRFNLIFHQNYVNSMFIFLINSKLFSLKQVDLYII